MLKNELTAINQYFLHSRMLRNWGVAKFAEHEYEESIDEMKHADRLIERILFLEGMPNVQRLAKVAVGETPVEQLTLDLALEREAIARFNEAITLARKKADNGTREMLEEMLVSEEGHLDWLEQQLSLVQQLGEQLYLSRQVHD